MFVSVDLCLIPIGVGTSLSPYIKECIEVIKNGSSLAELKKRKVALRPLFFSVSTTLMHKEQNIPIRNHSNISLFV